MPEGALDGHHRPGGAQQHQPYFAELARGIEDQCAARGYCVFFCNSDDDPIKQRNYLRVLQEKRIDGLIIASAGEDTCWHRPWPIRASRW
uniref:hypothetical protein n=1 Tax=Burkholderia gladioli TaxID=28095 RepID=UPI002AAF6792|nr:hypothetical protein [Burkholderia gladioli]